MRQDTDTAETLAAVTALCERVDALAEQVRTQNAVRLRGCRYVPISPGPLAAGSAQRITTGPCEWAGYSLAETGGAAAATVTISDAAGDEGDPIAVLVIPAGGSVFHFNERGVGASHGLTLTVASTGAATVTGAVYVARA